MSGSMVMPRASRNMYHAVVVTQSRRPLLSSAATARGTSLRLVDVPDSSSSVDAVRFMSSQPRKKSPPRYNDAGLLDVATGYLAELRLRAAKVLSSSLSLDERGRLLTSIRAVDEAAAREDTRKSIGEAVAAAVAKEAEKKASKKGNTNAVPLTGIQEEEIRKQAEAAAMARVQSDLLIQERRLALERWRRELEKEKEQEQRQQATKILKEGAKAVIDIVPEKVEESKVEEHAHPILGPAVVDLKYKRVHLVKASALAAIPIWEKQRAYRHERAKVMANDKLKTVNLGLPGIIALHEDKEGKLSILDGQHRVGMMAILQQKAEASDSESASRVVETLDMERVLVEVFPFTEHSESSHATDIFTEINKAEPVKLVDMPGVAKGQDRRIINKAASSLQEEYSPMFKPSQRCRPPHLNMDNLRDAIFAADVLDRHTIKSQKALVGWLLEQNEKLCKKYTAKGVALPSNVTPKMLEKAIQYNFFLGLESSWLYN
eukprot:scaffold3990_cov54-Attheya_sp.AAC.2